MNGIPNKVKLLNYVNEVLESIGRVLIRSIHLGESDRLGEKEDRKKREMEAEDHRKKKSEQKQMRDYYERLKRLETCEDLVCSVLEFGMDHINNLKVKDLRVLLRYQFWSEKLKGITKKIGTCGCC